jgi:hypothetical protein
MVVGDMFFPPCVPADGACLLFLQQEMDRVVAPGFQELVTY